MQKQVALVSLRTVRARRRATAHNLKIIIDIIFASVQRTEAAGSASRLFARPRYSLYVMSFIFVNCLSMLCILI